MCFPMSNKTIYLILICILMPLIAFSQLRFEPDIVNQGINFQDTNVGDVSRVEVTATATPVNDVMQQVTVSVTQGEFFSAAPAQFNLEPEQRGVITVSFQPQRTGNFEGTLRITAGSPMGRVYVYETRLTGSGVDPRRPIIVLDPQEFEVVEITDNHRQETLILNIANNGDADLNWQIQVPNLQWLRVNPLNGNMRPGNSAQVTININEPYPGNGDYQADLVITSNDPDNRTITVSVRVNINLTEFSRQVIILNRGWNMISANRDISEQFYENGRPSMQRILSDVMDNVIIIKDGQGRFAIPRLNFWELQYWNSADGYQVKMAQDDTLIVMGNLIPYNRPLDLRSGWNLISYYPDYELRGVLAFDDLLSRDLLLIAKDGLGNFLIRIFPDRLICRPGQGYMVKVTGNCQFRWAPRQ